MWINIKVLYSWSHCSWSWLIEGDGFVCGKTPSSALLWLCEWAKTHHVAMQPASSSVRWGIWPTLWFSNWFLALEPFTQNLTYPQIRLSSFLSLWWREILQPLPLKIRFLLVIKSQLSINAFEENWKTHAKFRNPVSEEQDLMLLCE